MELQNGSYQIQGIDVLQLCEEFDTPLYVYDAAKIAEKYKELSAAFSGIRCKIKYAGKALSNLSILRYMKELGAGLDAVSYQEVLAGLHAGYRPEEILYTPNCVSFEEIRMVVDLGVLVNIDNISILEQFGHEYGGNVPCCIRLNPHIQAGGNLKIQTGHIDSKFGISIFQMRHVLRIIAANHIRVSGLHVHTGSDILDAAAYMQGADILFQLALEFEELEFIDFGSGFKVAYKEGDVTTDIAEMGKRLSESVHAFGKTYGREPEIWFEPGKYLVSESGHFFVRSNVIKPTPATVFVGVDSGMNHLIRPMFYDSHHEILNVSNPEGTRRIYTVVGYICETDTFGWDRKLAEVREGDILAMANAGAYGFSMSSNYNSRFRPSEVLILDGKAHLIRKRESFDDIIRNQILIDFPPQG
jgi:diaminopimelate decarboxylase